MTNPTAPHEHRTKPPHPAYGIWQWGRLLFRGTRQECIDMRQDWVLRHGNVELNIGRLPDAEGGGTNGEA